MNCLCYGGYGKAVVWNRVSDETGKRDGTITLCEWCEGLIDSTPTKRTRAFSAGKLQWQLNLEGNNNADNGHTTEAVHQEAIGLCASA